MPTPAEHYAMSESALRIANEAYGARVRPGRTIIPLLDAIAHALLANVTLTKENR